MKAILEFNLPEDQIEFDTACKAADYKLILSDLDEQLRSFLKYGHTFKDPDEALQMVRDELYDLLRERNLSLYD